MSEITSVEFDQPSYNPGDTITATAHGDWGRFDQLTVQTDDGATAGGQLALIRHVLGSDSAGRQWQVVSNDGTTAVLTATA